jgi:hypothetical protein
MNCVTAHEHISLAAYGELTDEQIHMLNRHLAGCPECHLEYEQVHALKLLADALPVSEPNANLIARSRLRLEEALDAIPPRRWYERLALHLQNNFAGLQSAPVAASLMLIIGAGAGTLGGYYFATFHNANVASNIGTNHFNPTASFNPTPVSDSIRATDLSIAPQSSAEIANIASVVRDPDSNMVEVRYNQVVPRQISGSLSDPSIRQLLMLASQNSASAGVRDNSIELLADECRMSSSCTGIRNVLQIALETDRNADVRLKALDGLEPWVAVDLQVRNAVLQAVLNDPEPRIRSHAIAILVPVEGDSSVRQVLSTVANSDQNIHIRTASRNVLNQVPEIQ